jgi:hypothetical protein
MRCQTRNWRLLLRDCRLHGEALEAGCRQHRDAAPHTNCDLAARRNSCFTQHQATSNSTYCKADITRA